MYNYVIFARTHWLWKYKWLISKTFSLSIIFFHLIYCFFSGCIVLFYLFSLTRNSCTKLSNKSNIFMITKVWLKTLISCQTKYNISNQNCKLSVFSWFSEDILRIIKNFLPSKFRVDDKRLISKQTRQLNVCVFIKCQNSKDRLEHKKDKRKEICQDLPKLREFYYTKEMPW